MQAEPLTVDDFAPSIDGSALDLMEPPTLDQWTAAIAEVHRDEQCAVYQGAAPPRQPDWFDLHPIDASALASSGTAIATSLAIGQQWATHEFYSAVLLRAPERQPYVYHYERFPHWKYHAVKGQRLVNNEAEEAALGPDWYESPADAADAPPTVDIVASTQDAVLLLSRHRMKHICDIPDSAYWILQRAEKRLDKELAAFLTGKTDVR